MTPRSPIENPPRKSDIARIEMLLSHLLRIGVLVSTLLIVSGLTTSLVRHPDYLTDTQSLTRLTGSGAAFPHTLADLGNELAHGRGRAIVTLGLLLLITTPVIRVGVSILAFAIERDGWFVLVTTLVFLALLASFLAGRVG